MLSELLTEMPQARTTVVLRQLEVPVSNWYRRPKAERKRPGPPAQPIPAEIVATVVKMATANPWYGYKRIAVMCRRAGDAVKNRQAYRVMREHNLLHQPRPREPELHQAAKLFELLCIAQGSGESQLERDPQGRKIERLLPRGDALCPESPRSR